MSAGAARRHPLEGPARLLVACGRGVRAHRLFASVLGLGLILALSAGYLAVGILDIDPTRSRFEVRVELGQSGGLLPGQDVTLRGVRIGRVASVDVAADKVIAVAAIDDGTRIPADTAVRTAALSAAGEQYLDFVPRSDAGPYLRAGSVVTADRTSSPVPLSRMLESLGGTLAQLDPRELRSVMDELGVSAQGPEKLAAIVDGGTFLLSTLDSVLPQTVSLLRASKVVLTTVGDAEAGWRDTAADLSATMAGVNRMSGGFAELVDRAPGSLATMDAIIAQNSPTMVQLLGNLVTVAQMSQLRVPALREFFFPAQRAGSALDAATTAFHDGSIWVVAGVYPRTQCDYGTPRRPGTVPDYPEPYLYADCRNPDPSMLPRGARNAPRPPGWTAPAVPPGADPNATADPTPTGPLSIPTPFGGSDAPSYRPPR